MLGKTSQGIQSSNVINIHKLSLYHSSLWYAIGLSPFDNLSSDFALHRLVVKKRNSTERAHTVENALISRLDKKKLIYENLCKKNIFFKSDFISIVMYITKHEWIKQSNRVCSYRCIIYYFTTKKYHVFRQYHGILITLDHTWTLKVFTSMTFYCNTIWHLIQCFLHILQWIRCTFMPKFKFSTSIKWNEKKNMTTKIKWLDFYLNLTHFTISLERKFCWFDYLGFHSPVLFTDDHNLVSNSAVNLLECFISITLDTVVVPMWLWRSWQTSREAPTKWFHLLQDVVTQSRKLVLHRA